MSDYNLGLKLDTIINDGVKQTGSIVSINGTEYRLVNGNTLLGLAANKPSASDAATSVGVGVYYDAVDTQVIEQSDGTNWVVI